MLIVVWAREGEGESPAEFFRNLGCGAGVSAAERHHDRPDQRDLLRSNPARSSRSVSASKRQTAVSCPDATWHDASVVNL